MGPGGRPFRYRSDVFAREFGAPGRVHDCVCMCVCLRETSNSCLIHAEPFPVTFIGFRLKQANTAVLRVYNKSATSQRFHIIPPSDSVFTIQYTKVRYFVPGSTLKIHITFTPQEQRFHSDRILVHCEDEFNLQVPVMAFPSVTFAAFPRHILLPTTPVGRRLTHKIPLLVQAAVPTSFRVEVAEPCAEMTVEPTEGALPTDGSVLHLTLTYRPRQYSTARTTLRLFLSDCGVTPATCTVAARCVPGLRRDRLAAKRPPSVQPRTSPVQPPAGALGPKHDLCFLAAGDGPPHGELDLTTHGDVAKLLLQKFAASVVVQQTFLERSESSLAAANREQARRFSRAGLQRATRLAERTEVRRGQRPLTTLERNAILTERGHLWEQYGRMVSQTTAAPPHSGLPIVHLVNKKLLRDADQPALWRHPTYDVYLNRPWPFRLAALERFVQAARTVVLRCRAENRLLRLRPLVEEVRAEREEERNRAEQQEEEQERELTDAEWKEILDQGREDDKEDEEEEKRIESKMSDNEKTGESAVEDNSKRMNESETEVREEDKNDEQ
ncbi:Cilia- and flagella-associated protein 221 [Amphibalanus amphitrite]|uniref:Cilia-and flagella-associated protein 221 n=1 Tax=Amphibalanus amphitrite TaxID=1232801 RepID=A0A6A4VLA1_AMPAM|nr:Cilia- and flagella-associated protein 221 [Amphibalanus amphitrite]